jgi:hypothetical protein
MSEIKNLICRQIESIVHRETAAQTNHDVWRITRIGIRLPIIDSVLDPLFEALIQVKEDIDNV